MNGIMDSVKVQGFCTLGKIELTSGSTVLSLYSHFEILLGGIGNNFSKELSKLRSMLSFLKSCLLPVKTDFRIAFPVSYSCHGEIHSNFGALTFKVSTEILDDVFRGTLGNTYHMFCSPCLLVFIHYSKLGSGSLTDRTYLRSCFTFINITTYLTYKFHNSFSFSCIKYLFDN